MKTYNHQDFINNPNKYKLFKTAVVKNRIINTDGTIEPDTVVGITYIENKYNRMYLRTEPLYLLHIGEYCLCYANNLHSFVL